MTPLLDHARGEGLRQTHVLVREVSKHPWPGKMDYIWRELREGLSARVWSGTRRAVWSQLNEELES